MAVRPQSFRPAYARSKVERNQDADRRRGTAHQRGYDSKWSKAARAFREKYPLCLGCEAVGRVEPAVLVDHIQPHRGDDKLFWRRSNWQPSCKWHHDVIKQRLEHLFTLGSVPVDALRLDSPAAKRLTSDTLGL